MKWAIVSGISGFISTVMGFYLAYQIVYNNAPAVNLSLPCAILLMVGAGLLGLALSLAMWDGRIYKPVKGAEVSK